VGKAVHWTASPRLHRGQRHEYPKLRERIEQHLQETLSQQQLVESCLQRYGSGPSTIKDMTARIAAFGQSVGGMTMTDEVVKGGISGYVFECTEIAAYTTLIAAAKAIGDTGTVRCCEQIFRRKWRWHAGY